MRLDHLLSKELHRTLLVVWCSQASVLRAVPWWWRALVPPELASLWGAGVSGWEGVAREKWKHQTCPPELGSGLGGGTLLGPERTTSVDDVFSGRAAPAPPVVGLGAGSCGR